MNIRLTEGKISTSKLAMIIEDNQTAEQYREAAHYWQKQSASLAEHLATAKRERDEAKTSKETEITRGEEWCRDFIAMRSDRDRLASELVEANENFDRAHGNCAAFISELEVVTAELTTLRAKLDFAEAQNAAATEALGLFEIERPLSERVARLRAKLKESEEEETSSALECKAAKRNVEFWKGVAEQAKQVANHNGRLGEEARTALAAASAIFDQIIQNLTKESEGNAKRLRWLHTSGPTDAEGYDWGIYRVLWENGKAVDVQQTLSDFSDLDAAMKHMKDLTDEQLNIEICKWRGWRKVDESSWDQIYRPADRKQYTNASHLPSHITGIEALGNMHEAEKGLTADQREDFIEYLGEEVRDMCINEGFLPSALNQQGIIFLHVHSTARQRAIALLRVVKPELFV